MSWPRLQLTKGVTSLRQAGIQLRCQQKRSKQDDNKDCSKRLRDFIAFYLLPGQVEGVPVGHDLDELAVDLNATLSDLHVGVECAEHGVVLEEVSSLSETMKGSKNEKCSRTP